MNTNKILKSIFVASMLSVVALPVAAQNHHNNGNYNNNSNYNNKGSYNNKGNNHNNKANSNYSKKGQHQPSPSYDYANVVTVNPVYKAYQVNNPVEQCYQEQVQVKKRVPYGSGNGSYTNEIIGGVVGAAVGNQVGKIGRGNRDVGTVVGAVLGATVANGIEGRVARNKASNQAYETVEHCETKDSYTTERKVVGYDVAYKYNGNVYHTQSDQHPGNRIRVQVIVKPA